MPQAKTAGAVRIKAGALPKEAALALKQFASLIDVRNARLHDDDHSAI